MQSTLSVFSVDIVNASTDNGNSNYINQTPIFIDGIYFLSVSEVLAPLGFEAKTNYVTQEVSLIRGSDVIKIKADNAYIIINNVKYSLSDKAGMYEGSIVMPIKTITESLKYIIEQINMKYGLDITTTTEVKLGETSDILIKDFKSITGLINPETVDGIEFLNRKLNADGNYVFTYRALYTFATSKNRMKPFNDYFDILRKDYGLDVQYDPDRNRIAEYYYTKTGYAYNIYYSSESEYGNYGFTTLNDIYTVTIQKKDSETLYLETRNKDNTIIKNKDELKTYLKQYYSTTQTALGEVKFDITVIENNTNTIPNDYEIWLKPISVYLDAGSIIYGITFYNLNTSNKYSQANVTQTKKELQNFMYELANDIIKKMPSKKLAGRYDESYYKYPNLKLDYVFNGYNEWNNYSTPKGILTKYDDAAIGKFKWYSSDDLKNATFNDDEINLYNEHMKDDNNCFMCNNTRICFFCEGTGIFVNDVCFKCEGKKYCTYCH
jgi:hypothetical protein